MKSTVPSPVVPCSSPFSVNNSELEQFFTGISSRMGAYNISRTPVAKSELEDFFATVSHKVELAEVQQRNLDKIQATGFNVFDLIEPDENKLSDIIADLLDPKGGHGQGDLFIRLLFKQLGLEPDAKLTENARVQREAPTYGIMKYRRRIDVLIEAGAWVAIENKVDSGEQTDQVKDYLEHLKHCTLGRPVQSALIYLTRNGNPPESVPLLSRKKYEENGKLFCWSYQRELRTWLESCRADCKAEKICHFLSDFISYIESSMKRDTDNIQEEEDNER